MADTLSKFGVPMGDGAGRGGILQPKQKHKFRVLFENFGPPSSAGIELTQQIVTINKPTYDDEAIQIDSYNSRAWIRGKHTWQTTEMVFRDDVTNSVSRLVGYQMQKQLNHFEQTSPLAGTEYKFSMKIEQMDGGNDAVIDQWVVEGAFITNVAYDQGDYSSGEPLLISLTVQFDNATHAGGLFPLQPTGLPGSTVG